MVQCLKPLKDTLDLDISLTIILYLVIDTFLFKNERFLNFLELIIFADSNAGQIYQLPRDNKNMKPVAINFGEEAKVSRPVALEYDPVEDRVYWTDVGLKIICRAYRNGSSFEKLVTDRVGVADGLTIDLAGRNLYWTSMTYTTTEVSRLDGSSKRVLISSGLHKPRDIIVDPVTG